MARPSSVASALESAPEPKEATMHPSRLSRRRLISASSLGASALAAGAVLDIGPAMAQDPTATPPADGLVPVESGSTPEAGAAGDLAGTIVIAFQGNDTQTFQALADAYMALHPGVTVELQLKPAEGYQEYIRAQFASGQPEASLVNGNVVADLVNADAFVDLSAYLDRTNPYTGSPWRDAMDPTAVANMTDPLSGEMYLLNLETVQILWFYNTAAFEQAGILEEARALAQTDRNQPTWDQFLGWCDKLSAAGFIPVAIEGNYTSFWEVRFGWLARMYLDQFTRDEAELARAQPGDWNFREGVDDTWVYDPTDPFNDDATKVTFSTQRQMLALRDGQQEVNGPKFQALYRNFKDFADRAVPPGWIGTSDAYPLFLTQQAAMRIDAAGLLASFERDIRNLAEGRYIGPSGSSDPNAPTPTPLPGQELSVFEIGSFNNPTMEGPEVIAPARTIEVNIGFYSVPKKDQAQNDLEVDFLMYLTSPEGFGLYLQNRLDPNNAGGGISGPPIVRDVELPAEFAERFSQLRLIGNTEKPTAGNYRARGVADYQPSVREWVDLTQRYFAGDLELQDYLDQYQASIDRLFPEILEHQELTEADLANPEQKPASQE